MSEKKELVWWRGEGLLVIGGIAILLVALVIAHSVGVNIIHNLLSASSTLIYLVIAALVFFEAAIFLGFVVPGEAVIIIGGVLASGNHVSLIPLIIIASIAAILGDSTGYWIGHRYGKHIVELKALDHHKVDIENGLKSLQKHGAIAVFTARFVAFLRAVMPGVAGASELSYSSFFVANALGGIIWVTLFTLIGLAVGYSYHMAELTATTISLVLLVTAILVAGYIFLSRRNAEITQELNFESNKSNTDAALEKEIDDVKKSNKS